MDLISTNIDTERLKLRIICEDDAQFLFKLMNTKKWHLFVGDKQIVDEETARRYITTRMDVDLHNKGFVNYVMIEKDTDLPVGTCSLHDREGIDGLDIGYALLTEFEGRGYALEGATAMAKLAFVSFNRKVINAITTGVNIRSSALLEKIGFKHCGYTILPGSNEELKLHRLLKHDFERYLSNEHHV